MAYEDLRPYPERGEAEIVTLLKLIATELRQILAAITDQPIRATLTFKGVLPDMPATIALNQTATAVFAEQDAKGNTVPDGGPVGFTSSNPSVATVDATGLCTPVAAGTTTVVGLDSSNQLTAQDVLTVTDPAVSATLTLEANTASAAALKAKAVAAVKK